MLISAAWHGAYLERVKDFPPLDKLLRRRDKPADTMAEKRALAENLKAALMAVKPTGRTGNPPPPPPPAPAVDPTATPAE